MDRLFDDPFAALLAGDVGARELALLQGESADNPGLALRTCYFDQQLAAAVRAGCTQVVLLGAGLDTRALRLPWPLGTRFFELDRAELNAYKSACLEGQYCAPLVQAAMRAGAAAERRTVDVDLMLPWGPALCAAGFRPEEPAVFVLEGLLSYLPDAVTAQELLCAVTRLAAPRSVALFDVVGESYLDHPATLPLRYLLESWGAPWRFGTDDPEGFVRAVAKTAPVQVIEPWDVAPARWPGERPPRSVLGVPRSYLVRFEL